MNGVDVEIEKYSEILHILPSRFYSSSSLVDQETRAWFVDSEKVFC